MRRSPSLCPDSGQPSELIDYDVHGCMCVVSPLCVELHGNDKWQTSSVSIKECFSIMVSGFSQPRTAFISKQFSDKLSFTGAQHAYMFWGGNWQMSHHSTPQILFFKTCVCKCACTFRTLCITVLFNNFRKVDMLFNTRYEFVKLLFFPHWICQSWFLIVNARARTEKEVAGGKWSSPLSTHEQARSSW